MKSILRFHNILVFHDETEKNNDNIVFTCSYNYPSFGIEETQCKI